MTDVETRLLWMFDNVIVYSDGRVSTLDRIFLQPSEYDDKGVPIYSLYMGGGRSKMPLWMLMYTGFVEDPRNDIPDTVSFKDNNPKNCAIDNLLFFKEEDGVLRELVVDVYYDKFGDKHYHIDRRLTRRVLCNENGMIYSGPRAAAKDLGLSPGNISAVLKDRRKSVGGYTFKYVPQGVMASL